ncbi:hypothetical protein HBI45_051680 [Parastagonospora nodorum]|nr:hypothetical protein HBI45_051680 [Parastagonospora nodorum]
MMEICRRLRLRTDAPDEAIRLHGACTHISKSSHLFITISIHIYSRKRGGKGKKEALTPARTNLKHAVVALVVAVANHPAPVFERALSDCMHLLVSTIELERKNEGAWEIEGN